jgi:hypothetical protein
MAMKQFRQIAAVGTFAIGLLAASCSDSSSRSDLGGPSTAANLQAVAGASAQTAPVGSNVPVVPAVVVKDAGGNVVPGLTVTFAVTAGGGNVANPTTTTNAQGIASAGVWTLGPNVGTNVLEARMSGASPVQFTATATSVLSPPVSSSPYAIAIRYLATPSPRQQLAVTNAVARWETVLTRDLTDIPVNAPVNACFTGQPALNERIDDILILVELIEIDGAGKILGEAGPCYVRSDNGLPIVGHLKLDAADLRLMESNGTIDDVVLHEIGHVLGIGTLWPDKGLLQGQGTSDPSFLGANAIGEYRNLGGALASVPVENSGGAGTRDGHWRESVFGNELMTGWVTRGSNPLSALTIASLVDLGYSANASAAGGFALSSYSGSALSVKLGQEIMKRPKFKIDRRGLKHPL